MVTVTKGFCIAKFPGLLILTIVSTIWISSQVSTVHATPSTVTPFVVKITYPHKGQQVGIGHNVTLLGTSSYNATSKCQVSIIVHNTRPYQNTTPIGQGTENYSQWKYTLTSTYTALREGINRVTAKLTCNSNPVFTKFHSINLTGINQPIISQQQIATKSNSTASPFFLPTSFSLASASPNSTNSTNTPSILPVSVNSSSVIGPSSTESSSSSSSGHGHIHHHSSSSSSSGSSQQHHSSSSSSSGSSHTHSGSENHDNGDGGHSSDSHQGGGAGHDFFHGAFSHFGGF